VAEITLRIDGMHCGSCIRRVTQAINNAGRNAGPNAGLFPFVVTEVRLGAARFQVSGEVAAASGDLAVAALAKAGFAARVDE